MKVLIADDEPATREILENSLAAWGYEPVAVENGSLAWAGLHADAAPPLAVLDWLMPEMDGVEVCHRVRAAGKSLPPYVILLTCKTRKEDIVRGLEAGANDYLVKPFDLDELRARVHVGERMVQMQVALAQQETELARRLRDVEAALQHIKQLQGLLPICAYCKKIRDDHDYWHSVESYLQEHADVAFSHSICPDCFAKWRQDFGP